MHSREGSQDRDILESIEPFYFQPHEDLESECQTYIIKKLASENQPLDLEYIISEKNRLKKQLSVVTKKVTNVMMTHQGTYFAELQKVVHLQTLLNDAINTCVLTRKRLAVAQHGLTLTPLKAVHYHSVKSNLVNLMEGIDQKKKLMDQEEEDQDKMDHENDENEKEEESKEEVLNQEKPNSPSHAMTSSPKSSPKSSPEKTTSDSGMNGYKSE